MYSWLRILGVANAAVWLGGVVFGTFFVLPVFFTPAVTSLVDRYFAGKIAQLVLGRYFNLQIACIVIGAIHLVVDRWTSHRASIRARSWMLAALLGLTLYGSWLLPRMERLHHIKYAPNTSQAQKADAARSFGRWHATSQIANLAGLCLVIAFFWQTVEPPMITRFNPAFGRR